MANKKNPSSFNKLQDEWYQKLKDSGFDDIETDEDNLKVWSSKFARKKSLESWRAKEEYYYMANNFLNEYEFATKKERIIWEYHASAISIRDIVDLLSKVKIKMSRTSVHSVIIRLENAMKFMYMPGHNV